MESFTLLITELAEIVEIKIQMRVQKVDFDIHVVLHFTVGIQEFVYDVHVVGTFLIAKEILA